MSRNNVRYNNTGILESGCRQISCVASSSCREVLARAPAKVMVKAINGIMFKAEGELIRRRR